MVLKTKLFGHVYEFKDVKFLPKRMKKDLEIHLQVYRLLQLKKSGS